MRSGEKTKANIKRAALALFVEKGVDGCGMRDIAKASDITEGAIYRHFSGKEDLVWRLFADNFEHFAGELDALQAQESSTAAKIEAMVQGFCRFYDEDETLFRFLLLVQHGQLDKVTDDMASPISVVMGVLQAGIDQGETLPDPTEGTAWVMGIVLQTATFKIYGRLSGPLSARASSLAGACLDALGI
ncbi:TetR/AcrR family transcriptional regulator [Magnetovibrio sp. PR-2]|uniref:TetR/AcrR family transcriptional regulator n=1 Tax=Magnetovibrio sp. PR-2 TaxID=3120356 RepID=UPI002FCDEE5F